MAILRAFGAYLPSRIVSNEEMSSRLGCEAAWIRAMSGIEQRRWAAPEESVADMAERASKACLRRAGLDASQVGMILLACGSMPRQFPGPAASVASRLGLNAPAIDLPVASAGSVFALALADQLAPAWGNILVVAAEKMSEVVERRPLDKGTAILFGDGAGACLVSPEAGAARIVAGVLHSDGTFAEDLRLEFGEPLRMNGRSVIMQASRKIPRVITEALQKAGIRTDRVHTFLMHQANQNLIDRVARSLNVEPVCFYSNIERYGNTSSASMLIAAEEWVSKHGFRRGEPVVFAGFGAGFHWGAVVVVGE